MRRAACFLTLAALLLLASVASAQSGGYTLDWWTVDSGGTSFGAGNGYTLGGTVGQPDARVWQGQGYTLAGGFWGGALVEHRIFLPLVLRNH